MNSKSSWEPLLGNSFVLDFIEITLTPKRDNLPIYSGPGSVFQDDKGRLNLKLYHPQTPDQLIGGLKWLENSGKLIKEEDYFRFEATDISGDTWISEILPSHNIFSFPAAGTIVNGELESITRNKERDKILRNETLYMVIPGKYNVPCNQFEGGTRKICDINLNGIQIYIKKEKDHTLVKAFQKEGKLLKKFQPRLLEALSIMLGDSLFPVCSQHISQEHTKTTIYSKSSNFNNKRIIPLSIPGEVEVESFQSFLQQYLETFEDPNQPFIIYWRNIHAAFASGYIGIQALAVCTSIEGIIKKYYNHHRESDIRKILEKLSKDGLFEKGLANNWIRLRNDYVHANPPSLAMDSENLQQNIDRIYSCLHIFYILLFKKIRCDGEYRDYLKAWGSIYTFRVFPMGNFPSSNETDKKS